MTEVSDLEIGAPSKTPDELAEEVRKLREEVERNRKEGRNDSPPLTPAELAAQDEFFKAGQLARVRENLGEGLNPKGPLASGQMEASHIANGLDTLALGKTPLASPDKLSAPAKIARSMGNFVRAIVIRGK
jgi:hypothetical protein